MILHHERVEVEIHGLSAVDKAGYDMAGALEQAERAVMKPVEDVAEGVGKVAGEAPLTLTISLTLTLTLILIARWPIL